MNTGDKVFDDYILVKDIGEGGFGTVWRAVKSLHGINMECAVKISSKSHDNISITRAKREIENQMKLQDCSYVVRLEDFSTKDVGGGKFYILIKMELLKPLTEKLKNFFMSETDIIQLGTEICSALEACARYNMIHRDIKPANIMMTTNGHYKLGDFGLARILENDSKNNTVGWGTSGFIAPEVCVTDNYDLRADVYSLGITMFYLLNGNRLPWRDGTSEWYDWIFKGTPKLKLDIPNTTLANVVLKACEHNQINRYQTAKAFREALEQARYGKAGIVSGFSAAQTPASVGSVIPSAKASSFSSVQQSVSVGNIIPFGKYNWRVLDVQNDRALLITENITHVNIEYNVGSSYHQKWETCSLRKWLNEEFVFTTFSNQERTKVLLTTNINDYLPANSRKIDNNTRDKVFLLSASEAIKYFGQSDQAKIAKYNDVATDWYLRTPGSSNGAHIRYNGQINYEGRSSASIDLTMPAPITGIGIRPVFWLNLGSSNNVNEPSSHITQPLNIGDNITLGNYNNIPIEWAILEIANGKMLLHSKNILAMTKNGMYLEQALRNILLPEYGIDEKEFFLLSASDAERYYQVNSKKKNVSDNERKRLIAMLKEKPTSWWAGGDSYFDERGIRCFSYDKFASLGFRPAARVIMK